jgi:hypothetical protein
LSQISYVDQRLNISESDCQAIIRDMHRGMSPAPAWRVWLIKLTYPLWRPIIAKFLYDLYEQRVIDSSRLHLFSSFFDKTQKNSCLLFCVPKKAKRK